MGMAPMGTGVMGSQLYACQGLQRKGGCTGLDLRAKVGTDLETPGTHEGRSDRHSITADALCPVTPIGHPGRRPWRFAPKGADLG